MSAHSGNGSPLAISARQLTAFRGAREVCSGVDFEVRPGECHGIVGPNGSGKTSLLLALRGRLRTQGELRIHEQDPRELRPLDVAQYIAVVPQKMEFSFPYRVEEMVLLGRAPKRRPWEAYKSEDRRLVAETLDRLGIAPLAHERVDAISGGERRKVFLARALVQETPVLFLDEPIAGLDPAAQMDLVELIRSLRDQASKTIVLVLHDLQLAHEVCDQVLGLRDGRPVWSGPPNEVMTAERLEELFGVPWGEYTNPTAGAVLLPRTRESEG